MVEIGDVEDVLGVDVGVVGGGTLRAGALELDAVAVDGEAALFDHLADVVRGAGADGVEDEIHRAHAGLGVAFAVDHHALRVRGDADEAFIDEVVNGCSFGVGHKIQYA